MGQFDNCNLICYNELEVFFPMASKPAYATGAQVEHQKFGLGSVLNCGDDYIVIKFDDHGEKKFVTSIVLPGLKKSDRQPPVEKRATRARKKAAPAAAASK
jgi:hypothetical protein